MVKQQSSRGAALVIVLFIVALAAILAVEMSANLMVQVQKSTNLQGHQQAKWYAYGAEELAIKGLIQSKKDDADTHVKTYEDQVHILMASSKYQTNTN